jgi:hypothetical protein
VEVRRLPGLAGLAGLAVLTAFLGFRAVTGALRLSDSACQNPLDRFPGWLIVVIGLVLFGVGHLTARYRASTPERGGPPRARPGDVAVHVLLVAFFLAISLVLVYETVGLLGLDGLQPITLYVACAKAIDPLTTTLASGAVSFLVGHWLWYPDRPRSEHAP